jgi:ATP-binding cassette, subfamily C (CFTR/MRP), member 1
VPAAVLSMVECLAFMTLSFLEHGKTAGSSLLLDAYLIITILFDAVRVRTLWLNNTQSSIAGLFTTCMLVKIVALILEESNKRRWLLPSSMPWSKEVTGGVFSRTLFAWLDRLMCAGYSKALSVATLPDIDAKLLSQSLWDRVGPKIHEGEWQYS